MKPLADRIRANREQRAEAAGTVESLDADLLKLLREGLDEGLGPTELAKMVGVTRARIYQILEKDKPRDGTG